MLPVYYRDDFFAVLEKPAGMYVHAPLEKYERVEFKDTFLSQARDTLGCYLHVVNRLDRATSGLVVVAFTSEITSAFQVLFQSQRVKKKYWAVVRGIVPESGVIDTELKRPTTATLAEAQTDFDRLAIREFQVQVTKRQPFVRYSWVEARPRQGRFHQIRRHFKKKSHPLVGDSVYGDLPHNRFWKNELGVPGLLLRSISIEFAHPVNGATLCISSNEEFDLRWKKIKEVFSSEVLIGKLD